MAAQRSITTDSAPTPWWAPRSGWWRGLGRLTPWVVRALLRVPWTLVAARVLLPLGILVQLVVVGMVYELVDLCISLAELWTELARKHLELTLTYGLFF